MTEAERILQDTDRESLIRKLSNQITSNWYEMGLFRSCLNCEHWIEGTQQGSLLKPEDRQKCKKFNSRPPTKVIVCGCSEHSDNIPF